MIRSLYIGPSSACFELDNYRPYYAPSAFTVLLDGIERERFDSNVFSLFALKPDTQYNLLLRFEDGTEDSLTFTTGTETCALNVRGFGAVGDGVTDDTSAIRAAIDNLPAGGRLYFPAGEYLTAPLSLHSHMTLEFAEGAHLLGTTDRSAYPRIPTSLCDLNSGREVYFAGFEGNEMDMYQSLLTASYAEDIRIIGPGCVDGNAQNSDWWQVFRELPAARPRLVFLNRCRDVVIHGIHGCNSPSWQFHPYYSKNVSLYQVRVTAPKKSPNTDAIDPEGCDGVNIIGCRLSVGDDCIAIKSGKIELGRKLKQPAIRHTVRNCLMEFGHGAVTLGSEIGAGVRELSCSQCWFRGTDRGLRIKTRRGRGEDSRIDGVRFSHIRMEDVLTPFVINMWYNCCDPDRYSEYVWSREKLPIDERTPYLGSFHFSDIDCTGAQVAACYIDGLPEAPIGEVCFENVNIGFAPDAKPGIPAMENFAKERCRLGLYLENVQRVRIKNVTLTGQEGDALIPVNCGEVTEE